MPRRNLAIIAVMNRLPLTQLDWNPTCIRYEPIFFAVGPGSDPKAPARLLAMGYTMAPPRAAVDGVAGLNTYSLNMMV